MSKTRADSQGQGDGQTSPCQLLKGTERHVQNQHVVTSPSTTGRCGKNWTGSVRWFPRHGKECWQTTWIQRFGA